MCYLFTSVWKQNGSWRTDGTPVQLFSQIRELIAVMMLPLRVTIIKWQAHRKGNEIVGAAAEAAAIEVEWETAPAKWCSKRNNVGTVTGGSKPGRMKDALADSNESEGFSECSKMSCSQVTASQETNFYPERMVKMFLQRIKGVKRLDIALL